MSHQRFDNGAQSGAGRSGLSHNLQLHIDELEDLSDSLTWRKIQVGDGSQLPRRTHLRAAARNRDAYSRALFGESDRRMVYDLNEFPPCFKSFRTT